jgi:hypothetical protein
MSRAEIPTLGGSRGYAVWLARVPASSVGRGCPRGARSRGRGKHLLISWRHDVEEWPVTDRPLYQLTRDSLRATQRDFARLVRTCGPAP